MSARISPVAGTGSPNRSSNSETVGRTALNSTGDGEGMVVVMQQVLDQMERCFQTDHSARRERIQQLEQRQKDLESMYSKAEEENHNVSNRTTVMESEVSRYSAKCDESVAHLLEECKLQTEEKRRFRDMNEGLEQELRRQRELEQTQKTKIEQLAKNVVKALKERATMADELEATKAHLEASNRSRHELQEAAEQRDDTLLTLAEVRQDLETCTKMAQIADLEVKRVTSLLDRHVHEDQRHRKETAEASELLVSQVTQQLTEVSTEKELVTTSLSEAQLSNQRLSEELRQMIASRRDRDERLAAAERELVHERSRRLAVEREITVHKTTKRSASAFDDGTSVGTPTTVPGNVHGAEYEMHKEVVRLQALLDRVQLEHAETLRHTEQRVLHANSLYEQANERCRGYETALLELRQQAANAGRERTKAQMTVQALRQKLVGVQAEGATTSAAIATTKPDVEEAMANANSDLELRFAQQVHKDFASIAYFFSQLRNLDPDAVIRIAGHSTGAANINSPHRVNTAATGEISRLPAAPESGLGVPPHQLGALGGEPGSFHPEATSLPPPPHMQQWVSGAPSQSTGKGGPRRSPSLSEVVGTGQTNARPAALVSPSVHESK